MIESSQIVQELQHHLTDAIAQDISSQTLINWSDEQHWEFMEGTNAEDETIEAEFLRDILDDIVMQWECLSANLDRENPEFPEGFLKDWLAKVQKWQSDRSPKQEEAILLS